MARKTFDEIFIQHNDGSLEPRQRIRVGGVTFGPGVRFSKGTSFGGVDFTLFKGRDIEVRREGETLIVEGIYR